MPVRIQPPLYRKPTKYREELPQQEAPASYRDNKTAEERKFYSSSAWTHASRNHRRIEPLCRECSKRGITKVGTLTDHIKSVREGGERWEESNLQTLCDECHNIKRQQESQRSPKRNQFVQAKVIIVNGPPASGKSTYVRENFQPGDMIVDTDLLFAALSGLPLYEKPAELLPFVCEARDAMLDRLFRNHSIRRVWIVTTSKNIHDLVMRFHAEVKTMTTDRAECLRRIASDSTRAGQPWHGALVAEWFA